MRAITIEQPGGPDVLTWGEAPDRVPAAGEVLLDVAASAVNRADLLQRQGHYPPPPGASEILGMECSGTIAELGEGVTGWAVGDAVCALLAGGGYAERVAVPAGQLLPIPAGVDLVTAAALPEVACTVHAALVMSCHLTAGETLLVHGGGSGIGTFAIQYATALGVRVAVTAGSAEKLKVCAELGAQILVNYREQDFVSEVRAASGGHGADVVLDNMGAKYLARNVEVLATEGRLFVLGLQGGATAELNLGQLLIKRASIAAAGLRARPAAEKAAIIAAVRAQVWPLVPDRVRPVVDRVVPIADARLAHQLVDDSGHVGKVLLAV
jgi:putative PIG3 family NAD(P)H quinone oxidoreductase